MKRIIYVPSIVLLSLLASACVTHETVMADAKRTLALPIASDNGQAAGAGLASAAWGDQWSATNLYKRAATADPSVLNRFNLASGYYLTGRTEEAVALYRSVARDGQFTRVQLSPLNGAVEGTARYINLGDEASRRLNAMARIQVAEVGAIDIATLQPGAGSDRAGDLSAMRVVAGSSAHDIPDDQAFALDAQGPNATLP